MAFLAIMAGSVAVACPICGVPTVTLPERLARADVALLVEWVSAQPAKDATPESTTYEIVQVHRDGTVKNGDGKYKVGEKVTTVGQLTPGKAGNLFLLLGQKHDKLGVKWEIGPALAVTETSYQYIVQAPSPETPAEKRLAYFIKFLEYPDIAVANDAFAQFVNAPTRDIEAVAAKLPREKIRRWLADDRTPVTRQSGYGLMLGLCGGTDEARFLEKQIAEIDPERQTGLEGVMFGYLLLAGDRGLEFIEKAYLANRKAPEGKIYPAFLAIRYFWSYGNGKISRPRLQAAMRCLLDQPALSETAITLLAGWKDWSLHERLMKRYGSLPESETSAKKAIIGYMIASTKDLGKDENEVPAQVTAGRKCLDELRRRDPKLVADTEKFFYVN
ncbi:MAG TPA: hypothetical protein VGH74_03480 [Planctomycetaceae bacterium]